jgi:hypothetical protein
MKTRVVCLPPGQLQPEMIVAAAVTTPQGAILFAAGAVLDEHSLEQLRRRAVEFVTVSVPDSRDEATIAREVAEATTRVDYIFRGTHSSARAALRETVLRYRRSQAE